MYKFYKTLTLVTIASPLNQNLSLLDVNEYISADTLAVIHQGYINVIPILNNDRRCKYVPLNTGKDRGTGSINQIKWLKFNGETLLTVASSVGVQLYDTEVRDVKSVVKCNKENVLSVCVMHNDILCAGTTKGTIWLFKLTDNNTQLTVIDNIQAHNNSVVLLDGMGKYLVSSCDTVTCLWVMHGNEKKLKLERVMNTLGLYSKPTTLKIANYLVFIGYESGEFCTFDILDEGFVSRTVAHKLKVTAFDFSPLKHLILTASDDCYIKVWSFSDDCYEAKCMFSFFNENGPICGVAFLNYNCTEFCCVTANDVNVDCFIKTEKRN